jgi:Pentapeptide repeats (8 copies)
MHEDFKGQDLRGRSFRGLDLSYADFSDARLGSNDFTGATLTGAKFCRARFGLSRKAWAGGFVLQLVVGGLAGLLAAVGASAFFARTESILKFLQITTIAAVFGTTIGLALFFGGVGWVAVQRNRLDYLHWLTAVILAAGTAVTMVSPLNLNLVLAAEAAVTTIGPLAEAVAIAAVVVVIVAVAVAGAGTQVGTVAVAVAMAITIDLAVIEVGAPGRNGTTALALASAVARVGAVAGAAAVALAALLSAYGFYLGHRAIRREESQLSLLRRAHLAFASTGASRFTSTLTNVDFTDADVKHVNFSAAQLIDCTFHNTKNLHLAQTKNTLLAPHKVRELLSSRRSDDHDFTNLNLTGANFAGMGLRGFDFAHANLSHADFSGCDLSQANLSAVTAVSAKFNRATLTDANIQNWNIDARTELADIICTRVFLGPNQTDPNPPVGEFLPGEFSKLYQQVADTVDFILHSPAELAAFIRAVDHLKSHGGEDIYVQNIERKEEAIVVKLKAPEGFDRDQIYKDVRQEFVVQLTQLETAKTYLTEERDKLETKLNKNQDVLNSLLEKMVARPSTVIHTLENHMTDKSQTIGNITNRDGVINLGNDNKISNKVSITLAPPEQAQLKALLDQLDQILKASAMPADDRDYALKQVDGMRDVMEQNDQPDPGKIQRALNVVQGIVGNLEGLTETGTRIGEVAGKIGGILGF